MWGFCGCLRSPYIHCRIPLRALDALAVFNEDANHACAAGKWSAFMSKTKQAFTLIELLIVVAIIGILAAIAVPNFLNAQMRAKVARTEADMKAVSMALEMYFLDHNTYVDDHDYPSDKSQKGLFKLTSPIAYMASLPQDAFGTATTGFSEKNSTFEFGSGSASGKEWPAKAYIIISPGPDRGESVSGNDGFPRDVAVHEYSMSNGLKTSGDIVLMGGEWQSGRIRLDGRWVAGGP